MEETWKIIPSHPDYEVSDAGRVRRVTGGKGVRAGRILSPLRHTHGYLQVNVYRAGKVSKRTVHSLVMEAFVGPRPPGASINHINGIKTDNRPSNLHYCTQADNILHASLTGMAAFAERNASTKLSDDAVKALRASHASGLLSQRQIAAVFGISQGHVSDIVTGKKRRY